MERINFNSLKSKQIFDNLNPKSSGITFSVFFHLIILLFAVGLPNFFDQSDIYVPNIVPIEIINVSDTTNTQKSIEKNDLKESSKPKAKKFNSSENSEIQKQSELQQKDKSSNQINENVIELRQKNNISLQEKKIIQMKDKPVIEDQMPVETIKTKEIKPKIKPKLKISETNNSISDLQIEPKVKKETIVEKKKDQITKPKPKPEEDFSIASMLKDLRNEKSNNIPEENIEEEDKNNSKNTENNESMILSISEIDLLRQQLSSCWNAPAGAEIERGMKVSISAKVRQNMRVFENSVRIVDTNISKSNPFYGPITDSAMRTLLNPECTPLKLPINKYKLWKNLTITFDYSIMKGF